MPIYKLVKCMTNDEIKDYFSDVDDISIDDDGLIILDETRFKKRINNSNVNLRIKKWLKKLIFD